MSVINTLLAYVFFLSLILIIVVYYVGVKTDTAAFSSAANSLINTATGRKSNGAFAGYPA